MSDGRRPWTVMTALSMLAYVLAGIILTTGAFYFLFFGTLALFPALPDRLQLGTLLFLVGIPIPGGIAGACLGVYLWKRNRHRSR